MIPSAHLLLPLLLAASLLPAAEPVAQAVDQRIVKFEKAMDSAFEPVRRQLEDWRTRRLTTAVAEVAAMLPKAGPQDRVYLAYHLLAVEPKHRAARAVFTALGLPPPFDEQGVPVPGTRAPTCDSVDAVLRAVEMSHPPFDAVAKAIDLRGSVAASFWKRLQGDLVAMRKDLVKLAADRMAEQAADAVYPMLAYYHPEAAEVKAYFSAKGRAVPRQRVWFNPVDRWLIDRELAGIDLVKPAAPVKPGQKPDTGSGLGSGELPEFLPGARAEIVATWNPGSVVELSGPKGAGVAWSVRGGKVEIRALGGEGRTEQALEVDLTTTPLPVQCEVRGRHASFCVGGIPVATLELPQAVAVKHYRVDGLGQPRTVRIRFIGGEIETPAIAARTAPADPAAPVPAAPAAPAPPAWLAAREATLAKPVTCEFTDLTLAEVCAMLTRLSGTEFRIAPSAEPLVDLPILLSAKGVPLRTALDWLQRLSEVAAVPDEKGFRLEWQRVPTP